MKKNYIPLVIIVIVFLMCVLALLINANMWLFQDFFHMDNYAWYDIVKGIGVILLDFCIAAFLLCNAHEIAAPDTYDEDDCE